MRRLRQEDNFETVHREIEWGGIEWIDMTQYRDQCQDHVKMVMNLQVALNMVGNC